MIQDPLDSQAFNRYSYVRNNPLKYTDPTGHSWFSRGWKRFKKSVKKHWKKIATIAVVAAVTLATGGIGAAVASAIGGSMGTVAAGATMGAIAGFTGGVVGSKLNGSSWRQALKAGAKGAVIGAVSGGVAAGVVEVVSAVTGASSSVTHAASFLGKNKGVAAVKSVAHGLSRAAIAKVRGQSAKAAFFSGFASSGFSVGTTGYGGFVGRTTIMSIVGGTASAIAGGDFKNGAMTGAFTHMFNAEAGKYIQDLPRQISKMAKKSFSELWDLKTWEGENRYILIKGSGGGTEWLDLRHALLASKIPLGQGFTLGLGMEAYQYVSGMDSGFKNEDLFSNGIGAQTNIFSNFISGSSSNTMMGVIHQYGRPLSESEFYSGHYEY